MWLEVAAFAFSALVLSALLTGVVRNLALRHGVLDVPNARSSHTNPTPRGGGASIVITVSLTLAALGLLHLMPPRVVLALECGGISVALVGMIDDQWMVPPRVRLLVHVAAAAWAVWWVGGPPAMTFGGHAVDLGWVGSVLGVLGIVWTLNLFNFMDGIDGIAASEAIFIGVSGGWLTLADGPGSVVSRVAFVFAAACAGFLLWNWPRAKIFMGDVGSGYLGYVIAVLALASSHENPVLLWVWLILGGVFFVDATVTLVRRTLRGDRVYQAHRTHAYQWLARRWGSHERVTLTVLALNLLWLLPCAWFALIHPGLALRTALVALAPLVIAALAAGAGRLEGAVEKAASEN